MATPNTRLEPASHRPRGPPPPRRWHGGTLTAIKAVHTILFASIGAAIALFVWDGIRDHPRRRTAYALGIALGETAVYVSNNQVCPLTPLAEQFGTDSAASSHLPARCCGARIPVVSGTALVLGLVLNGRALIARGRRPRVGGAPPGHRG